MVSSAAHTVQAAGSVPADTHTAASPSPQGRRRHKMLRVTAEKLLWQLGAPTSLQGTARSQKRQSEHISRRANEKVGGTVLDSPLLLSEECGVVQSASQRCCSESELQAVRTKSGCRGDWNQSFSQREVNTEWG